jgi:hypothetical protein
MGRGERIERRAGVEGGPHVGRAQRGQRSAQTVAGDPDARGQSGASERGHDGRGASAVDGGETTLGISPAVLLARLIEIDVGQPVADRLGPSEHDVGTAGVRPPGHEAELLHAVAGGVAENSDRSSYGADSGHLEMRPTGGRNWS